MRPEYEPAECSICNRHAVGLGIGNNPARPQWLCEQCALIARDLRAVRNFDPYELRARDDAGDKAGAYLDSIGKTDLAELSEQEWWRFLETVIGEFGDSIRRQVRDNAAPF